MSGSSDSSDDPKIGPRAVRLRQVWEAANMLSAAVQVSKHVSGNTRHSASGYGSLAPLRDRFLHADVPPSSHPRTRSRLLKVYGFPADAAMARVGYEKAKDLGSTVAPQRLERLARRAR
jgi:hypothetical protein